MRTCDHCGKYFMFITGHAIDCPGPHDLPDDELPLYVGRDPLIDPEQPLDA